MGQKLKPISRVSSSYPDHLEPIYTVSQSILGQNSTLQQFHYKLNDQQCRMLLKKFIQNHFGFSLLFPTFSDELFESTWALDNLLKQTSANRMMLVYANELYVLNNYSKQNRVNGGLAAIDEFFIPIQFTRNQFKKCLENVSNNDHERKPSHSEMKNIPLLSNIYEKTLLLEWNLKWTINDKETNVTILKTVPLWIGAMRLREFIKSNLEIQKLFDGNFKLTFPNMEFKNLNESKLVSSMSSMFSIIFELFIMYISCPLLVLSWVAGTESRHIQELFDDHHIGTIPLFTCCELFVQRMIGVLDSKNEFGKDLLQYFGLLKSLGQHGIGAEWKDSYRLMFENWRSDMVSLLDQPTIIQLFKPFSISSLSTEMDFIEIYLSGNSLLSLPKVFISERCRDLKLDSLFNIQENKWEVKDVKNSKIILNLVSFWIGLELLDDKNLQDLLKISSKLGDKEFSKQLTSLMARRVTDSNSYKFFKIAQDFKITSLTDLCNLFTQLEKYKKEHTNNTNQRRRSLAVVLKRNPSESNLADSPFQFTKLSYHDGSELQLAFSQATSKEASSQTQQKEDVTSIIASGDRESISSHIGVWICGGDHPGKTSLISTYMFGQFDATAYDTSINESYRKVEGNYVIDLKDSSSRNLEEEKINKSFIGKSDIFIICYSVKNLNSFKMARDYIDYIKTIKTNPILLIAALQCDSPKSIWKVTTQDGLKLANDYDDAQFFEISSYLGINVRDIFMSGTVQLIKRLNNC
ncbi:predicted protein [Naegleria gruberi]|uniref:Predicted protein n=1 Tax=Naegleria gruberi TaxID=5762 RepID=D2W0K9_NAEGR|nr:uncharacterized protein NAEGRDRAFT_74895 [Naegleria gruberi]EFC37307.1 predicted protein [Naegleria gruberi]|eukprot:XP_002670051.1 predicted protein [Naegleria gruberi strain NEG-M]